MLHNTFKVAFRCTCTEVLNLNYQILWVQKIDYQIQSAGEGRLLPKRETVTVNKSKIHSTVQIFTLWKVTLTHSHDTFETIKNDDYAILQSCLQWILVILLRKRKHFPSTASVQHHTLQAIPIIRAQSKHYGARLRTEPACISACYDECSSCDHMSDRK
jgi:hypothetical protein